MPSVYVGPGTLILGDVATANPFSCDLTECRIDDVSPTYSEVTGCGTQSANGSPDIEMSVAVVQDVTDEASLLRQSWTLHNTVVPFHFLPNKTQGALTDISAATPAISGQVLVTRLSVGASATGLATASKTWKVQGDVQIVETAPTL